MHLVILGVEIAWNGIAETFVSKHLESIALHRFIQHFDHLGSIEVSQGRLKILTSRLQAKRYDH